MVAWSCHGIGSTLTRVMACCLMAPPPPPSKKKKKKNCTWTNVGLSSGASIWQYYHKIWRYHSVFNMTGNRTFKIALRSPRDQWVNLFMAWGLRYCFTSSFQKSVSYRNERDYRAACYTAKCQQSWLHLDGLVQERRNSSALAMELHLSCTNLSISSSKFFW